MSRKIPIIKIYGCLIVSIQIELSDNLVVELKDNICEEIQKTNPRGLIIELSGVDIIDSYIARSIRDITQIATLMGVRSVIVGLDPGMAITLVEMGVIFSGMLTTLNVESAMELLKELEEQEKSGKQEQSPEVLESLEDLLEIVE